MTLGLRDHGILAQTAHGLMRFVFLGSEVCLQLPSDPTSRWTPVLFG